MVPIDHGESHLVDDKQVRTDGGDRVPEREVHYREENPQGLLYFTKYNSVPIMVDALFDSPTSREFTQSELASKADITPRSVRQRIDVLYQLDIIEEVEDTGRFSLNLDSEITWKLRELDGLIKEAVANSSSTIRESSRNADEENGDNGVVDLGTDESLDVITEVRSQMEKLGYAD